MSSKQLFSLSLIFIGSFILLCHQSMAGSWSFTENHSKQDSSELEFKTFKKAKSLMAKKDYQGAVKELESINTSSAFLKQMLINCYIELKNFPKARITLKEYYKSDGQSASLVSTMKELEKKIATAYSEDSTSFQKFKESSTALKNYIKGCPYSFFAKEVMDRIDELDYKQAESNNTEEAYMFYLSEHPKGNYASDAKSKITSMIAQKNDELNRGIIESKKSAKNSYVKAGLFSAIAIAGGIGVFYGFTSSNKLVNFTLTPCSLILIGIGGRYILSNIKSANRELNWARNARTKIRQIPSFSQIRLSPFTDFSTTGGISLNIKF
jgi:hypothetical protein